VKSTLDNIQTQQYSTLITQLTEKAQNVVRDIDPEVLLILIFYFIFLFYFFFFFFFLI